jgi:hypothetical protein
MKEYIYTGPSIIIDGVELKQNSLQNISILFRYIVRNVRAERYIPKKGIVPVEMKGLYLLSKEEEITYDISKTDCMYSDTPLPNSIRRISLFNINNNGYQVHLDEITENWIEQNFIEISHSYKNIPIKKFIKQKTYKGNMTYDKTFNYKIIFNHEDYCFVVIANEMNDFYYKNEVCSYLPERDINGKLLNNYEKLYNAKFIGRSRIDGRNIFELLD